MNPVHKQFARWRAADPDLRNFLAGILFLGINHGILTATFNNYLHDTFAVDAVTRGWLELPRELPGFALIFLTGLLACLPMRSWAVLVGLTAAGGIFGLAWLSPNLALMTLWMVMWSVSDHLFMPVEATLGLRLARANAAGRRLGQLSGARSLSIILGSGLVWLFLDRLGLDYPALFSLAVITALLATLTFRRLRPDPTPDEPPRRFVYRRAYHLFYLLNVLWGARKQLFLTFSPWVLVSVFDTPASTMALLILVSSVLGVAFRQVFGWAVDRFGERAVLSADALILVGICLGFALSASVWLLYGLYMLDNLMFATRIARTTYLNRIAASRTDVAPTIALGISMDHVVSMLVPVLGGWVWAHWGYPAVFWLALLLGLANLAAAARIRT